MIILFFLISCGSPMMLSTQEPVYQAPVVERREIPIKTRKDPSSYKNRVNNSRKNSFSSVTAFATAEDMTNFNTDISVDVNGNRLDLNYSR